MENLLASTLHKSNPGLGDALFGDYGTNDDGLIMYGLWIIYGLGIASLLTGKRLFD